MSENQKIRFTYTTEKNRISKLKILAVMQNSSVNVILDKLIDEYLKRQ